MPQDHSKWSNNFVYSNNFDIFNAERDAYCQNTAPAARDPKKVSPTFQVPVGHRDADSRRQRERRRGQLHLGQLAERHDVALGARNAAR